MSNRFSSDSLVYNSIDDIPKSGSCFGTISKSIKIGTITIPAYSRFSFINTGTSTDGALFAIDSNGYSYTAYRTSGVWNKCFATATKDDLTKSIDFRGNAKMFKVRSGTDGLKNIYLDIEDESGNTCSLAFLSDGENTVKLILNGKTVWTK